MQEDLLRKVTLNLYDSDVEALKFYYGWGWSEQVRLLVRSFIQRRREYSDKMRGAR